MVKLRQIVATGRAETGRWSRVGTEREGGRKEVVLCARGDSTAVPKVYLHLHSVIKLPYSSSSPPRPRFRDTRLQLVLIGVCRRRAIGRHEEFQMAFSCPGHVTEL